MARTSVFRRQPNMKRIRPRATANPTPAATARTRTSTQGPSSALSTVARSADTAAPAACNAPMAGSAKVAAAPSRVPKARMKSEPERPGIVKPMFSAKGIRPRLTPSMKHISPSITAMMPRAISSASSSVVRSASAWKPTSINASGTTARSCSAKRTET